jgi:hypothetical protein
MPDRRRGTNLAPFRAIQLEFAAHVRHPELNPGPEGIERRRLGIYAELVYDNIERFLAHAFPVAVSLHTREGWHARVRDFIHRHRATSPFFQEIPQEFLEFVASIGTRPDDPPYLLELMHYEWVELALDLEVDEIPQDVVRDGDLLAQHPVVSPLAWSLAYNYPVHHVSATQRPEPAATHLVVYRDRADAVRFLEANAATARLLELLRADPALTGADALTAIATEMSNVDAGTVVAHGRDTLGQLRSCDIIAGVRTPHRG